MKTPARDRNGWKADVSSGMFRTMYRVTVEGSVPTANGEAAKEIETEFREHRTWHQRPICTADAGVLRLVVENDFDSDGTATLDEFGDAVLAYIGEHGSLRVVAVETI